MTTLAMAMPRIVKEPNHLFKLESPNGIGGYKYFLERKTYDRVTEKPKGQDRNAATFARPAADQGATRESGHGPYWWRYITNDARNRSDF